MKGNNIMKKNKKNMEKPVRLPEGRMCSDCCADCDYSGERDWSSNKIKCGKSGCWVEPTDYCWDFRPRR